MNWLREKGAGVWSRSWTTSSRLFSSSGNSDTNCFNSCSSVQSLSLTLVERTVVGGRESTPSWLAGGLCGRNKPRERSRGFEIQFRHAYHQSSCLLRRDLRSRDGRSVFRSAVRFGNARGAGRRKSRLDFERARSPESLG